MSPITKAIDEAKFRIPMAILREAFRDINASWKARVISLDEQIMNAVVKSRVLVDCNLVGGTEAQIPLDGLPVSLYDQFTTVYQIPKSLTQGRSIMSVLSVGYAATSLMGIMGGMGGVKPCSVTPMMTAAQAMMDSHSQIPVASSAQVQLIGENVVMIKGTAPTITNSFLRCILANDENMSHIQMRSIPVFCRLVELAIKSYVYNELIIRMDQAQLSGGGELGAFKAIVEGYADSEELYQEHLMKKWSKTAFMNDKETFNRHIKLMVGAMR